MLQSHLILKPQSVIIVIVILILSGVWNTTSLAQLPKEQPLWPGGIPGNPVEYKEEKVRTEGIRKSSLSQNNRVFSCVSVPAYVVHSPAKGKCNGVAMVICPGSGFRDVWFDREGNDLGLWLAQKGITSLVLKYRTFNSDEEGFKLSRDDYNRQVYAHARQAVYLLRSKAKELGIDVNKIGIGGFSAGVTLSLMAAVGICQEKLPAYVNFEQVNTDPDFVGLFYPGLNPDLINQAGKAEISPVFIMNGGEDTTTPASNCIELYNKLTSKKVSVEMHIYAKGGHGFDSGVERGNGIAMWRDSFVSWLKDMGFITE
jgi:acetyl esterase/lipase